MNGVFPRLVARALLALALLANVTGCYPSNVLEERDRSVREEFEFAWGPLEARQFPGAYASTSIIGDAAASLLEVRYVFQSQDAGNAGISAGITAGMTTGIYTGAGLVLDGEALHYQTLDGIWQLTEGRLVLDGDEPGVSIEAAEDHIRLTSEGGAVILRRFELR